MLALPGLLVDDVDQTKKCLCLEAVPLRNLLSVTPNREQYWTTVLSSDRGTAEEVALFSHQGFLILYFLSLRHAGAEGELSD